MRNDRLHGLIVLDEGWYLSQEAYSTQYEFKVSTENVLLQFINGLVKSIASSFMGPASIDRYMKHLPKAQPPGRNLQGHHGSRRV